MADQVDELGIAISMKNASHESQQASAAAGLSKHQQAVLVPRDFFVPSEASGLDSSA